MEDIQDLMPGARKLVSSNANVKSGEKVLIVTDPKRSQRIGAAIYQAALEKDAVVVKILMEPGANPGAPVPEPVAAAMKVADVIIGVTTSSLYHTQARLQACANGARLVACTEMTEDMLISGGILADFEAQRPLVEELERKLNAAREVRLTTPGGTDLRALRGERRILPFTGLAHKPGDAIGVPDIEVCVCPWEGTAEGVVVVDASATALGLIHTPIRIVVSGGRAVAITGGEEAQRLRRLIEESNDPNGWNLAEMAVGLNPCCRVTGHIIEDEGAYGTCHMALGSNVTLGGNISAKHHIDLVQWKPTLYIDGEAVFSAEPSTVD